MDGLRGLTVMSMHVTSLDLRLGVCSRAAAMSLSYRATVKLESPLGIPVGTAMVECGDVLSCN
jgi:hypothetical protein